MEKKIETEALVNKVKESYTLTDYLTAVNDYTVDEFAFSSSVQDIIKQKGLKKSLVVEKTQIDRVYCYELIKGKRKPSRDKVILFCLAMVLTVQETQILLKHSGFCPLNPKIRREAIILFGLSRGIDITSLNILLCDKGYEMLM